MEDGKEVKREKNRCYYTVSDSCLFFRAFSVQGGNSTDVKIHSSKVKMYSADVKIHVKFRNQQIAT